MFAILPLTFFVFLYAFICHLLKNENLYRQKSFILAAVCWSVCVVIPIEILSASHNITIPFLFIYWALLNAAMLMFLCTKKERTRAFSVLPKDLMVVEKVQVVLIAIILLLVGLVAFLSAPNSWDTLNYHMSRVVFWVQNASVAHYPTPEFRQLYFQPWVEYAALHFQILSGTDRFANLICWFSYVGSVIGAGFLAALFGAKRQTQILTMLLCATVPTLIIESSGMRVGPATGMFVICFVILIVLFKKQPSLYLAIFSGMALGIGMLTKGTTYLIIYPFVLWLIFIAFTKLKFSKAIFYLSMLGLVAVLVNAGFFYRNFAQVQDILGPASMRKWGLTTELTPGLIFSNILRTIVYQLGNPINPWNDWLVEGVKNIHLALNIDIIDPRTTASSTPFHVAVSTYEDSVTNFLQVILWLIGIPALLWNALKKRESALIAYLICLLIAFATVAVMIKWSNQATRYFCAHYVLASVAAGIFVERYLSKRTWIIWALIAVFSLTSIPYVFRNNLRRLVSSKKQTVFNTSRTDQYFRLDSSFIAPYTNAAQAVKALQCDQIALHMKFNYWDYPFFILLDEALPTGYRLEHIMPDKSTPTEYPLGLFEPCAIISVDRPEEGLLYVGGVKYKLFEDFNRVKVYKN